MFGRFGWWKWEIYYGYKLWWYDEQELQYFYYWRDSVDDNAFEQMKITLSPTITPGNEELVRCFVERYNSKAEIFDSKFKGLIRWTIKNEDTEISPFSKLSLEKAREYGKAI